MGEGLGVSIRHRTAAAVVAAFLLGAGITACSDDGSDEPADSGLPSDSETSASSPTPTEPSGTGPTPPELPDAADGTGPKAAEAFVRHYVDLINYTRHTFDVEPLREASGPKCNNCAVGIENMLDLKKSEAHLEGGNWSVVGTQRIPGQADSEPVLDVVVRHTREQVVTPGEQTEVNEPSKNSYTWWLEYTEPAGWRLVRWDVIEIGI